MGAPNEISQLVEMFESDKGAYKSKDYNETLVRVDFINPFFEALGWEVTAKPGSRLAYREVVHEDRLRTATWAHPKAPDYCFYLGGLRKFFVDAKKPSVPLTRDPEPARQVRRYGWTAKLPVSVVTDFEEFVVYDCRIEPGPSDKAGVGQLLYIPYTEYVEKWDTIASLFSREAVRDGSLERFIKEHKPSKPSLPVDSAFLKEISAWRERLARNIAEFNDNVGQQALNFAVQMTIDRILFLRICEAQGIETGESLDSVRQKVNIYAQLRELFQRADERFNSGLFHFKKEKGREDPDTLTLGLRITDAALDEVLKRLYQPISPYAFDVIPVEILGQVYEQFLGKVIRLDERHRAVVEEKPEVRKAGGVYYTPTYIVDYIVLKTVGRLLHGKTPEEASKLRIVDPACGSGSFLIGAYNYLLNYHLECYLSDGPEKHERELDPGPDGGYRLSIGERKRILLNNIYGVDIDSQAVEVTKLSLLLKVLEGETERTLGTAGDGARERVLPDLGENIKCGNSLIGPDFYESEAARGLSEEEARRVNPFDWEREFAGVMKGGWFDAVIGNPPYIRMESFKDLKNYLKAKYASHDERSDLYAYFIEQGHKLLKNQGQFGMIVSNKFLRANYGEPLRRFLHENATIERIVDFAGLPVFIGATVRTIILLTIGGRNGATRSFYSPPLASNEFAVLATGALPVEKAIAESTYEIDDSAFAQPIWSFAKRNAEDLLIRLQTECQSLTKYCDGDIFRGVVSGLTEAFTIDEQTREAIIGANPRAEEIIKPFLNGRDVRRYYIDSKKLYLIYTHHGVNIREYPAVKEYLRPFRDRLEKRATNQEWYELQQPQYRFKQHMAGPKIIFPDISIAPRFALDEVGYFSSNTTYFIPRRDLYLLGLLNSRLGYFYFVRTCAGLEGKNETYLRFFGQYLEGFPVRTINFDDPADKKKHDKMVELVERILELHKRLGEDKSPHEKDIVGRQIEATDGQIDRLVYELYGLSGEEVKVVVGKVE